MGGRSIETMAIKPKQNEVTKFIGMMVDGIKGSWNSLTASEAFEEKAKELWTKATEAKDQAVVASLAKEIEKSATTALEIDKEKDEKILARKRAKLSRILKRIGITRRASGTKGEPVDEKNIQATLAFIAKLEKTDARQRKLVRAVYDRLLKAGKTE